MDKTLGQIFNHQTMKPLAIAFTANLLGPISRFALYFLSVAFQPSSSFAEPVELNIVADMNYDVARQILIGDGWQPIQMHRYPDQSPKCVRVYDTAKETEVCRPPEIDDCSGTGMGFCSMFFINANRDILWVRTVGGRPPNAIIDIWRVQEEHPEVHFYKPGTDEFIFLE